MDEIFNKDQIKFIQNKTQRGGEWSADTVTKTLKLYVACGQKGYEEVRRQNLSFPNIRTLQYRIQELQMKPGINDDILNLLQMKVSTLLITVNSNVLIKCVCPYFAFIIITCIYCEIKQMPYIVIIYFQIQTFQPEEKHAVLLIDEMAIKPGLQYDNSTGAIIGRSTMKLSGGFNSSDKYATHSLVFMLCGISTKWKQAIGYELTANSFCSQEMFDIIMMIIKKAYNIRIIIKVVISDMGPQNRSWWKKMNIVVGQYSNINNCIQHPCNYEDKLFVMPDSVHIFKNVACALSAGHIFHLDQSLLQKYNLPHDEISIEPIRQVFI